MDVLAERLLLKRKEMGRTQQWIADRLPVDRTTYAKYESGSTQPSLKILCQLATLMNCSVDWLLGRD